MQFRISHTIRYAYSQPVFLEPHEVRMQPRNCGYQTLREFNLQVTPPPAGMSHCLDAEGNNLTTIWFDGAHRELTVTAYSRVEAQRENPFDYLLRPSKNVLPMQYGQPTANLLEPALRRDAPDGGQDAVAALAERLRVAAEGQLIPFLDQLNQTIYADFEFLHREEGDPWPPAQTLLARRGACRDVAVLFVDACRCLGIAARFVSGYQQGDTEQERRELHAWAEVYVPGGGWRGYDPMHGLAVADRHVAVAASARSQVAAPLSGAFRGDAAATMQTNIELQTQALQPQLQQAQQQQQGA